MLLLLAVFFGNFTNDLGRTAALSASRATP
jgi:hypothetical protein